MSMYRYTGFDQRMVDERVAQYRDQLARYRRGELTDDEFRPLRLQNGLYIQRHAPMLRLAIPYGLLSSRQMRMLAHIARTWDRGYGHFTTRQNIQFNWPRLEDSADILQALSTVQMHAIQTSGNCVRNITTDPFAGVAPDEQVDPRPYCELLRQWSTFHPEFAYLPRKFKIALTGARGADRAATAMHDIGLYLRHNEAGATVVDVLAGGGMGRTPVVGTIIRRDLPWQHVLSYCEAILRVYNRYGRRDNKFKARIKILLRALGAEEFAREVDADFAHLEGGAATATEAELARIAADFEPPPYRDLDADPAPLREALQSHPGFARWHARNVHAHRVPGYAAVAVSLKRTGTAPGDLDDEGMDAAADLAERFSFGELRVTHEQNLVLADVAQLELFALWNELRALGLATPNIGLLTDIVCCPGGDFCSLANAKSMPIAQAIQERFDDARLRARPGRPDAEHVRLHQFLRAPSRRQHRHPGRGQAGRRVLPDHARRHRRARPGQHAGRSRDRSVFLGRAGSGRDRRRGRHVRRPAGAGRVFHRYADARRAGAVQDGGLCQRGGRVRRVRKPRACLSAASSG